MPPARPLRIETPLGPDVFQVARMEAEESLSELFRYRLQLLAPRRGSAIPVHELLGQPVAIHLTEGPAERHFHGIVQEVVEIEQRQDQHYLHFEAEVVPTLWLLTQRVRSRVFQNQSVPDILKVVLAELRPDVEFQLQSNYPVRNYVVQYRESDFAFISRLMEEEGISYYFRHEAVSEDSYRHVLALVDRAVTFPPLDVPANLRFDDASVTQVGAPRVLAWKTTQRVRRQVFTLRDQHFELAGNDARRPLRVLQTARTVGGAVQVGAGSRPLKIKPLKADAEPLEWYDHNSGFARRFEGEQLHAIFDEQKRQAQLREEEETASAIRVEGRASYVHLVPGRKFSISNLDVKDGTYLLTRVVQTFSLSRSGSEIGDSLRHDCHFTCVPEALPVRPARKTPKPRIEGTQTAVVTGVADKGIDVDSFGRVKVQFYWDRADQYNQNSSCWVRVSQLWAGNRWGAFFWPRPGMEVIVSFEDGDPDRPLVTGCVYNAANMPSVNLPAESALAGFKSCSVGSTLGPNNVLVFYDSPGDEHVFQHSPCDEARINRGLSYRCSEGTELEFIGGPLPVPGSGSGGGLGSIAMAYSEYAQKGGQKGAKAEEQKTPAEIALGLLDLLVPKKAEYTTGSGLAATITGTKTTHGLFTHSAAYNISDDFEAIGRALGWDVHPALIAFSRFATGLNFLPPAVSLGLFSNKLSQEYWGVSYTVERKGKATTHVGGPLIKTERGMAKGGKAKKPNPQYAAGWVGGVWVSLVLLEVAIATTDVLIVVYNRKFADLEAIKIEADKVIASTDTDVVTDVDKEDAKKEKKKAAAPQKEFTMILQLLTLGAAQIVTPLLHSILYLLESTYAELVAVRKKFKQAVEALDNVTKIINSYDLPALKKRSGELKQILANAKNAAKIATANMMDVASLYTKDVESALDGYVQKDFAAGLAVGGAAMDVMVEETLDDSGSPRPGTGSIHLLALSATPKPVTPTAVGAPAPPTAPPPPPLPPEPTRNAVIALASDGSITHRVRTAMMGIDGSTYSSKTEAYVEVGDADEIRFEKSTGASAVPPKMAPLKITMAGTAIELTAGDPAVGSSSIKIEADGITFTSGPAAAPATMKISKTEIISKLGVTTVGQSPQDLQLKAASTELKLEAAGTTVETMKYDQLVQMVTKLDTMVGDQQAQIQKLKDTLVKVGT